MPANEPQPLTVEDRDNLVAYLDGELEENQRQELAIRLTRDSQARREVEALDATWQLLDYLPQPQASPELTHRTLTQIHRFSHPITPRARRFFTLQLDGWGNLIAALTLLGLFGLAYVSARWLWPDPTARLADRLSLAEHLDEYRALEGDLTFLQQLQRMPEFGHPPDHE
jgi:ferric-dicitrate binding protein FerR (iron transport regulator)